MQDRFSPVICDPAELRERTAAKVRVVTSAGLRLGLARRVFAREPWLPSEVETEEEEDVRFLQIFGLGRAFPSLRSLIT